MPMPQLTAAQLGAALKKFREQKRITIKAFSIKTGIAQGHLSELENGRKNLTSGLIDRIAAGFGLLPDKLAEELDTLALSVHEITIPPGLREMPPPYSYYEAPIDDVHQLASWLVSQMDKTKLTELLNAFTNQAVEGDQSAASRARGLLLLLQKNKS